MEPLDYDTPKFRNDTIPWYLSQRYAKKYEERLKALSPEEQTYLDEVYKIWQTENPEDAVPAEAPAKDVYDKYRKIMIASCAKLFLPEKPTLEQKLQDFIQRAKAKLTPSEKQ